MRESDLEAGVTRLNRLLNLILETAVEALGFDAATISARHPNQAGAATIAATDQRMIALDDAQYESGHGPCLAVLERRDPIHLEDAADSDTRWEHFSRTAASLGVRSTLSLHVPTDADAVAASLNMYARRRLELSDHQMRHAQSYAEQLAATIQSVDAYRSTATLAHDMAQAMRSRAVIEQAKGILMAEERIDADAAFARLVQLSQRANTKLRDAARRLVDERSAPLAPDGET
jgi:transcriptional regulator with GAF, ATPase, and Fis domain